MSETLESYRPRSLIDLHRSESVSMLSERFNIGHTGHTGDYDTQSLDRRKFGQRHMASVNMGYMEDNMGYISDVGGFNSFHGSLGSKQSLGQMSGVSDSPEKYRDIAL